MSRDRASNERIQPIDDPEEQRLRQAARLIAKGAILYARRMAREAEERKKAEEGEAPERKESA